MTVQATLHDLEQRLLTPSVRRDARQLASLLADDFREFGSSGQILTKDEIVRSLQFETPALLRSKDFAVNLLSDQTALVTYCCVKQASGLPPAQSLRSSVWVFRDGRWQMFFHQGTLIQ